MPAAPVHIGQVTTIARQMVGRWGMSDAIGFVRVLPSDGRGSFFGSSGETSEATQRVLFRRTVDVLLSRGVAPPSRPATKPCLTISSPEQLFLGVRVAGAGAL